MNAAQAKQIAIADFLAGRGIPPAFTRNREAWYCSPIHDERTPSFKIDLVKNLWYDHGLGTGGDLLKLVQLLDRVDTAGALEILCEASTFSFHQHKPISPPDADPQAGAVEIRKVQPLKNQALIQYITSRCISLKLAVRYVEECYFRTPKLATTKDLFALAFRNDNGGYELRNAIYKGATAPKGITTIPGGDRSSVAVFEGFIDFLSAMAWRNREVPTTDVIILNGVGNTRTAVRSLAQYNKCNLFLDNDSAGEGATSLILSEISGAVNWAKTVYPNHKDFNEFITTTNYQSTND